MGGRPYTHDGNSLLSDDPRHADPSFHNETVDSGDMTSRDSRFYNQDEASIYSSETEIINLRTVKYYEKPPRLSTICDNDIAFIGHSQKTVMGMVRSFRESVTDTQSEGLPKAHLPGLSVFSSRKNQHEYSDDETFIDDGSFLTYDHNEAESIDPFPSASSIGRPYNYFLPDKSKVISKGLVLGRVSFMSMFRKKWRQLVWVRYTETQLLLFRNTDDYQVWITNNVITDKERNDLVKLKIDFLEECAKPEVGGFYLTETRLKHYNVEKSNLYQFKLDCWISFGASIGPNVAAAFASSDEQETEALRKAVLSCIKAVPGETGGEYSAFSSAQSEAKKPTNPYHTAPFNLA
eukprot:CAMPEP_0194275588 /NCGR_PEP_ID=MMETSP0169-20130528/8383_1 /TAXON_ID=218684 /ORGANISM="Corethron pennatum, Strain L29A3" /LENGTH=348 /DNA_ID=CAMNT_0039019083 /DNA_START=125 /DNA_END=1171 /DNA_ORIENTATION=+